MTRSSASTTGGQGSGGSTSRRPSLETGRPGRSAGGPTKAPAGGTEGRTSRGRLPFSPWVLGFRGHRIPRGFRESASRGDLSGIILFRDNLGRDWNAARELVRELQRAAPAERPLLFLADEEGGLISQTAGLSLPGGGCWPAVPTPRALGRSARPADARWVGALLGRRLRSLGIRLALAPCLDLDTEGENPVIGSRSFGPEPERAAEYAWAFSRGLADSGVGCAFKHYPGHGGTSKDSHLDLPVMDRADLALHETPFRIVLERAARMLGAGRLRRGGSARSSEEVGERAGAGAGAISLRKALGLPFLMPAHVDWGGSQPASLDPELLRRPRRWLPGVPMITDALDMKAVSLAGGAAEAALLAGNDLLLVGRDWEAGLDSVQGLVSARQGNPSLSRALARAQRRVEPVSRALAAAGLRSGEGPPDEDLSRLRGLHLRALQFSRPPSELPPGEWVWLVPEGLPPYAHLRAWEPPAGGRRWCGEVIWIPGQASPSWAAGIARRLSGDPRALLLATLNRGRPDQSRRRVLAPLLGLPGLQVTAHLLDESWPQSPQACVVRTSGPSQEALDALARGLAAPDSAWEEGPQGWHLPVDKSDITLA